MPSLYKDSRLYFILGANSLSAIGSGIVMITIPWLLIKESGGDTTFGYVSIIATLIMFLLTPFIGQSIDRYSYIYSRVILLFIILSYNICVQPRDISSRTL